MHRHEAQDGHDDQDENNNSNNENDELEENEEKDDALDEVPDAGGQGDDDETILELLLASEFSVDVSGASLENQSGLASSGSGSAALGGSVSSFPCGGSVAGSVSPALGSSVSSFPRGGTASWPCSASMQRALGRSGKGADVTHSDDGGSGARSEMIRLGAEREGRERMFHLEFDERARRDALAREEREIASEERASRNALERDERDAK
jgi:hypothetical protein